MKEFEYTEGPKATRNFDEGMKAIFSTPKPGVAKREKNAKKQRATSVRKTKRADKD
jgi:hypothetical protein